MRRLACVDIPALPLQLLLRRHPEWREHPVAVVDRDHPQGRILWADERARRARVLPGLRYAAALSLCGSLRAAEVPAAEVERAVDGLVRLFWRFSPGVEVVEGDGGNSEGAFWLDATGLKGLYPSLEHWGALVRAALAARELEAVVVAGFTKLGTYAVARGGVVSRESCGVTIFATRAAEAEAARQVPLERLSIDPRARDLLAKLGVHTAGELAALPAEGVHRRFGPEVARLHRWICSICSGSFGARGDLEMPLSPRRPRDPLERRVDLGYAESDVARLFAVIAELIPQLLAGLARRDEALAEIEVTLSLDGGGRDGARQHREHLRTAAPTLDAAQVLELVRLRLESKQLPGAVTEIAVRAVGGRAAREQLELFAAESSGRPPRDLGAADRALARLRAELGDGAVVAARLRDGHLPEAAFSWEPLASLRAARVEEAGRKFPPLCALVRRIYDRPLPLPPRPRHQPDGWMLRGLEAGPVVRVLGPYVVSGGWWRSSGGLHGDLQRGVHREYHFAETQKGEVLWVYYDRLRRRWFIQGRVE